VNIGNVERVIIAPKPRKRQAQPVQPAPVVPEPVPATAEADQPVLVTA
jgi:hypothetical protein